MQKYFFKIFKKQKTKSKTERTRKAKGKESEKKNNFWLKEHIQRENIQKKKY